MRPCLTLPCPYARPPRLSIDMEGARIEVASDRFEGMRQDERQALVRQLLAQAAAVTGAALPVEDAAIVCFTPPEYFASLKKWC